MSRLSDLFARRAEVTLAGQIERLARLADRADAVLIGAGAGLSTAAGLTYDGARFDRYFGDFKRAHGIPDMYSGGFFPYDRLEEYWAWWSRHIYVNRYQHAPKPVYDQLLGLMRDRDYFVLTTNVDHQFQLAGFDAQRLFYTQGDYGLVQCSEPCHQATYENEAFVRPMLEAQGFRFDAKGALELPAEAELRREVPQNLVPHCPVCGKPMVPNLRCDDSFVEDKGWHAAAARYQDFVRRHRGARVLYLELGVGGNTPVIIKYPFWKMTLENPHAVYACVNYGEAFAPRELGERALCIDADIAEVLRGLCGDVAERMAMGRPV